MFFWTPFAFVRIVVFFIGGILIAIYNDNFISYQLTAGVFIFLVIVYFLVTLKPIRFFNPGSIGLLAILIAGYLNTVDRTEARNPNHIIHHVGDVTMYKAVVISYAEEKEKSWKADARIQSIFTDHEWKPSTGKLLLYFSKTDFSDPVHYGDELLIKGNPMELKNPANPGEFDYKRFLSFRKIYHQHFLRGNDVQLVSHHPPNVLLGYSYQARTWAENVLDTYIIGKQENAVARALILGIKDGLDNDLVSAYASSGAMHVLAVSGLHVGIIYMIVLWLFKPVRKTTAVKWLLAIVSILILWTYAFITGLSPSVLRAVTMFSFIALAKPLNYHANIYNTLAVAAFCLLMVEPYMIMSVGFQLSFLAVIGIVYLQPMLYRLWEPGNLLVDKVWQITCVSIAAQMATFALGLLYFHQFPVYFLFSNLFVIPGAFLSLFAGLVLLATSAFPVIAGLVGFILESLLWLLNFLVFMVERLPFSLINDVYISTFQSWLMLGFVLLLVMLFQYRKFAFVVLLIGCGLLLGATQWYQMTSKSSEKHFVVYQVKGHSALEWVDQGKSFFFTDSVLLGDRERIRFHIRPNRLIHGVLVSQVNDEAFQVNLKGSRLILYKNHSVLQIQSGDFSFPVGLEVDYIVLSNNVTVDLKKLSTNQFKKLIIDSSYSFHKANELLRKASPIGLDIYSVHHNGAFTSKI